jgi:hypothetical protein
MVEASSTVTGNQFRAAMPFDERLGDGSLGGSLRYRQERPPSPRHTRMLYPGGREFAVRLLEAGLQSPAVTGRKLPLQRLRPLGASRPFPHTVDTISALMVCMRFSAWSMARLSGPSNTSSVASIA